MDAGGYNDLLLRRGNCTGVPASWQQSAVIGYNLMITMVLLLSTRTYAQCTVTVTQEPMRSDSDTVHTAQRLCKLEGTTMAVLLFVLLTVIGTLAAHLHMKQIPILKEYFALKKNIR